MASGPSSSPDPTPLEVPQWLKPLPLAPEYHPTLGEFADPISFILKIEKEASAFGICKIVPPLPPPPKKTTLSNLNRSFAAREPSPKKPPTFTTRQQQIGFCPRRPRPVQKPVWQSGETYTLQQFEAKAKQFERAQMKKHGRKTLFSPLEVESLFWRACADKPFSVEYANDMPGSGFAPIVRRWCKEEEAGNVGESGWNMRGVSRAKGSLLRFMREEIPGVTSPMVYVAMMFSWFAWHVEDHELHSLNYLHFGAGKTWYGVPRDAALAFEDVVRVEGYGGEVNPLVTCTILGEKTTVMSPEVLIGKGIPCCRLVQNAGEFVVTFPGAYHSGFSHGFNCAEAANIATPGWLTVAKEAAVRRASINYPPMVSHFQLLYALALSLCSRVPLIGVSEPRSSRLKDKMRGEGEVMVKEIFVQNVIKTNDLLSILLSKGSSCIVLPQNTHDIPLCSNSLARSQLRMRPRLSLGLCSREEALEASRIFPSSDVMLGRNAGIGHSKGSYPLKGHYLSVCQSSATSDKSGSSAYNSSASDLQLAENEKENAVHSDGLLDRGLLSCVTCGILSFTCVAAVQPREPTARYLMSADCGFLNDQNIGFGVNSDRDNKTNWGGNTSDLLCGSAVQLGSPIEERENDELIHCTSFSRLVSGHGVEGDGSGACIQGDASALALLASVYGDSSDSEKEVLPATSPCSDENNYLNHGARYANNDNHAAAKNDLYNKYSHCTGGDSHMNGSRSSSPAERCPSGSASPAEICQSRSASPVERCQSRSANPVGRCRSRSASPEEKCELTQEFSEGYQQAMLDNVKDDVEMETSSSSIKSMGKAIDVDYEGIESNCYTTETTDFHQSDIRIGRIASKSPCIFKDIDASYAPAAATENSARTSTSRNFDTSRQNSVMSAIERSKMDSSRMHVFCLEHALEVEKLLHPMGGVNIMILCHSDYPKIESEAKLLADELESGYEWKNIDFRGPTLKDIQSIRAALEDEESMPTSSDWAVKLGINLFYSANLSKSPLYSKQMPYNTVIYNAFGCSSPNNSPVKTKSTKGKPGRQRKIVVAGKWCGKVWMTNQVHPFLVLRKDAQEKELAERVHFQSNTDTKSEDIETEIRTKITAPKKNLSGDNVSSAVRRSGKRKKQPLVNVSVKKPKCTPQVMDKNLKGSGYAAAERSSTQSTMVLRSCRKLNVKYEPEEGPSTARSSRRMKAKDEAEGGVSTSRSYRKFTEDVDDGGQGTRLRTRPTRSKETKTSPTPKKQSGKTKVEKKVKAAVNQEKEDEEVGEYPCNIEGCTMSFSTKHDLALHKKDICPEEGCGKKFFSHKYLLQHRKVHMDDRPLACPWKGCKMRFKWAWARTEHIRVHTGDRPYICRECSQTFRFVSDFSRHKRKTGHATKKGRR